MVLNFISISFIIYLCLYCLFLMYFCYKSGRFFKTLFGMSLSGLAVFTAINILSSLTGVSLPVNAYTLGTSSAFGIPGVLALLTVRIKINFGTSKVR